MNAVEKVEQMKVWQAQAATLLAEGTPESLQKAEGLLQDAEALKAVAVREAEIKQRAENMLEAINGLEKTRHPKPVNEGPAAWGDFEEFCIVARKALNATSPHQRDPRLRWHTDEMLSANAAREGKQMVENVGASGGFLVPTEFLAQLYAVAAESSIVRNRATIIRMARRQIDIPVLSQTGTTAGQPHFFGGMLGYWNEEASQKTITTPSFRKVSLVAHKLIGYTRASDELLSDSAISLTDFLSSPMGFAGLIAWMEDYAFLRGTGVGQPLGILNAGATLTVNRIAQNPAVSFQDLANMRAGLLSTRLGGDGRIVWVINQSLMDEVIELSGPTGNPAYVWIANGREAIPETILGYPVIWTEKLPAAGSAGDVMLLNLPYYLIGDRQATTIESTQFDQWAYDETSWRAVHRVDGQPWLSAPLTLADSVTQISPFVILGAKST